jgi:hypothetical protein
LNSCTVRNNSIGWSANGGIYGLSGNHFFISSNSVNNSAVLHKS